MKRRLDEAIACHQEAIRLDPNDDANQNNLGVALYAKGRLDEAYACFQESLRVARNQPGVHANIDNVMRRKGPLDEAIAAYEEAIRMRPKSASAHHSLAWALAVVPDSRLRDPTRAVEHGNRAVQLAPERGSYWNTLGVAYYRAGDWAAAIDALEKAEALEPERNLAVNGCFLAMAHWQKGERDQARRWYDKAVARIEETNPACEELLRFRAEAAALIEEGTTPG